MADTAKVILIEGNPANPEPAEHIIKFPGGSIAVCRTSDNEYWAHIEVNHKDGPNGQILEDDHRQSKNGEVVTSRVDYNYPHTDIPAIQYHENINHIAVRIKTKGGK